MNMSASIRILETESNKRGDLFTILMADLFLALGYDAPSLNIQRVGREVDIEAKHRLEPRFVMAECKATKEKVGGDAINKFVGSLDAERWLHEDEVHGYFVSLSGFTQTAIEQEKSAGQRVILVDGEQVVKELINGRIIVSLEKAMERAGRAAAASPENISSDKHCELLGHQLGWIWAIYFSTNNARTHFALVHADGELLPKSLADLIIQADNAAGGPLGSLTYLGPAQQAGVQEALIAEAQKKYFNYLLTECGEIHLEGLPADQEVGLRRLNLESLFVPLYLQLSDSKNPSRELVGSVLSKHSRLAILAPPGGGKSTLLKRLAVAYAFPNRRHLVDDQLPDLDWFPLFIRCRQLGHLAQSPIREILLAIPERAELSEEDSEAFSIIVNRTLRGGNALLLIDGLDEIVDDPTRTSFVYQLRTFLATYPNINIVITSREVGFRTVGGALSSYCAQYTLGDFTEDDIKRLTLTWHKEVVGDRTEVHLEAEKLAAAIVESSRVRQLAKNPLLLTTLLLVKRWVGQLPSRRSVLYGKAIEVLLMTWNVEAHQPIDQDEAIPQLAFVAYSMMSTRTQEISLKKLRETLNLAREQMPEVLAYAKNSVGDFINRVEFRSSLLMLSGHKLESGVLVPTYEFRHLTFQEYLAAVAIVEGHYPHRKDSDTLLSVVSPHLSHSQWREVIPLTAVLAGRRVQPLMKHLIALAIDEPPYANKVALPLLFQCVMDESHVTPSLLQEALECIIRREKAIGELTLPLFKSKYGPKILETAERLFISGDKDLLRLSDLILKFHLDKLGWIDNRSFSPFIIQIEEGLFTGSEPIQNALAALLAMTIAKSFQQYSHTWRVLQADTIKLFRGWANRVVSLLYSDTPQVQFAACRALISFAEIKVWNPQLHPEALSQLIKLWESSPVQDTREMAALTISRLPVVDRSRLKLEWDGVPVDFIAEQYADSFNGPGEVTRMAALTFGYYLQSPWSDDQLMDLITVSFNENRLLYGSILDQLGPVGKTRHNAIRQSH